MEVFRDIAPMRAFLAERRVGRSVALVPTMGALHEGHGACVRSAVEVRDSLPVVSIFINPTQFGPDEDLDAYPRSFDRDLDLCTSWGVEAVFAPRTSAMYPVPQTTWIDVGELTGVLCGATRPGHFRGVTTVVAKLLHIIEPDIAVFGQKDAQQALVIRRMLRQLEFGSRIVVVPIAREKDGLALSSRNAYLNEDQRKRAASIFSSLQCAGEMIARGERDPRRVEAATIDILTDAGLEPEYAELRGLPDLCALEQIEGGVILAVAARAGRTRLIDNRTFFVGGGRVEADALLFDDGAR